MILSEIDIAYVCISIVITTVGFFLWAYYRSFVHELGHLSKAAEYDPNGGYGIITRRKTILIPHIRGVIVNIDNSMPKYINSEFEPDNHFLTYTNEELVKIAKAGTELTLIMTFVLNQVILMIILMAKNLMNYIGVEAKMIVFIIWTWVFAFEFISIIRRFFYKSKNDDGYTDLDIIHDPEGFRKYQQQRYGRVKYEV